MGTNGGTIPFGLNFSRRAFLSTASSLLSLNIKAMTKQWIPLSDSQWEEIAPFFNTNREMNNELNKLDRMNESRETLPSTWIFQGLLLRRVCG